jgi:hypothetical protein
MPRQKNPAVSRAARRRATERRTSVRFLPRQEITCYWSAGGDYSPARVSDLSSRGVCLFVRGRVETGTELTVELINGPHTFLCARRLRVLHVYQSNGRDAVVGGSFDRTLNYDELLPFMA